MRYDADHLHVLRQFEDAYGDEPTRPLLPLLNDGYRRPLNGSQSSIRQLVQNGDIILSEARASDPKVQFYSLTQMGAFNVAQLASDGRLP
jgi:hypothetical protein